MIGFGTAWRSEGLLLHRSLAGIPVSALGMTVPRRADYHEGIPDVGPRRWFHPLLPLGQGLDVRLGEGLGVRLAGGAS